MGIDADMAVALRYESDIEVLNKRFREVHNSSDCLFPDDQFLISNSKAYDENDTLEYKNTFNVNTHFARYYSVGYSRGNCPKILLQLEWLRAQPEVVEVYYGGDCGVGLNLWTKEQSTELMFHWFRTGESTYRGPQLGSWK